MKAVLWSIVGLVAMFFMIGAISNARDPLHEEKASARRGIELCDKGVKDDLQARTDRLFLRGICDKMRKNYQTKYGSAP